MRFLILFLFIIAVVWVGTATPIDPKRWLINRPTDVYRNRRSPQFTKGSPPISGVKGQRVPSPTFPSLRKGEYVCGNKVCKLKPGEIPSGCNGICQYRLA